MFDALAFATTIYLALQAALIVVGIVVVAAVVVFWLRAD
jgi:hypothetical protein